MRMALAPKFLWLAAIVLVVTYALLVLAAVVAGDVRLDRLTVIAAPSDLNMALLPLDRLNTGVTVTGYVADLHVPAWVAVLTVLPKLLWALLGGLVLVAMYRLSEAVAAGEPFNRDNVRRLHRSGWALITAETASIAASLIQDAYVRSHVLQGWHLSTDSERDPVIVIAGLLLLALARAFHRGHRLDAQAKLTI